MYKFVCVAQAQLQLSKISKVIKLNELATFLAAQNSAKRGLEFVKKFQHFDIKIPAIAQTIADGKPLTKSQLEEILRVFEERGWNSPKTLGDGWMNHEQPSQDWIECLLHGGSDQWAIDLLHQLEYPTQEATTRQSA